MSVSCFDYEKSDLCKSVKALSQNGASRDKSLFPKV